jgi:hypothetical protein
MPETTTDALLVDIDALLVADIDGGLLARLARLAAASVSLGLLSERRAGELDGTLDALRTGPGPVLLATEAGAFLYDLGASGLRLRQSRDVRRPERGEGWRLLVGELATRGIPLGATLLLGPDPVQGPKVRTVPVAEAAPVLDALLERRARKRVPALVVDEAWAVEDVGATRRRPGAQAATFTVGDGGVATRGVPEEDPGGGAVLATGTYSGTGARQHLRPGPGWTALELTGPPAPARRVLDLRAGVLLRTDLEGDRLLRTLRFASAARPGVMALRAEAAPDRLQAGPPLQPPAEGMVATGRKDGVVWSRTMGDVGGLTAAAVQDVVDGPGLRAVERLAVIRGGADHVPAVEEAVATLNEAARVGFDALLAEHRAAWARRWTTVDVEIPDDPAAQQAFRFALFQLWANVGCPNDPTGAWTGEERAVGARGLSGQGYAGHVFWDADVFVLPAMATICPAAARAMLEYRIRRLPAAAARAAAENQAGARFPWESARDGDEVTPTSALLGNEITHIRTGELEEHISADIAWAAHRYAAWTGDHDLLAGPGRPLLVETARYWASRITRTPDGRGHIDEVIGPDEYHEDVDDNAFTNIMARWNLRRGAELVDDEAEAARWRRLADELVDGYDPVTGRHEQFRGYHELEPLFVADIAPLPFAADLVLGRGRVWRSQLIKQADVLMAHFLVPADLPRGSLEADLDFYVPRTSHGSSLSPAITAGLLARAGRPDEGLDTLRMALRLDLDDLTGSSTGGLHLATIGGTWAALVDGFLGLAVRDGVLHADPRLPSAWRTLRIRLQVLGARIVLDVTTSALTLTTDRPLRFRPAGWDDVDVEEQARFERTGGEWIPAK